MLDYELIGDVSGVKVYSQYKQKSARERTLGLVSTYLDQLLLLEDGDMLEVNQHLRFSGVFINYLIIRVNLSGEEQSPAFLVKDKLLDYVDHRKLPRARAHSLPSKK